MEAIIFCGIQASGKSSFYKERFFRTHMRLSMDMLNTRNKEGRFMQTCFDLQQRFVIDNTNPEETDRRKYIDLARAYSYKIIGYYFPSGLDEAMARDALRTGKECVGEVGLRSTFKKLRAPSYQEGFDELYSVSLQDGGFIIELLPYEV